MRPCQRSVDVAMPSRVADGAGTPEGCESRTTGQTPVSDVCEEARILAVETAATGVDVAPPAST
jgi:hypothetical protein